MVLPDDLILGDPGCLSEMVEAYGRARAGHIVAAIEVDPSEASAYGVLDVTRRDGRLAVSRGMVEKPESEAAPSRWAVVGRHVIDGSMFEDLAMEPPGAGGEIQLTEAIARDVERMGLAGYRFSGRRFDCGSKTGMLNSTIFLARQDPDYAGVLVRALEGGHEFETAA